MTTLPVSYRLLLGLVPEDFDLLRPHLEPVLADTSPLEAMVHMPGSALRMPQMHSVSRRAGAPISRGCCFGMSRCFMFRSRYRRRATIDTGAGAPGLVADGS